MNCRRFKGDIIEWARGGRVSAEARSHARSCPDCWELFEEQSLLSERERSLSLPQTPPELEAKLLGEFLRVRRPRRSRAPWVLAPLAVAAALLLALTLKPKAPPPSAPVASRVPAPVPQTVVAAPTPAPAPPRRVVAAVRRKPQPAPAMEEPFVQIPYTQPLAPWERGEIMRMELPVAALIAQGFSIATSDAGAAARADVLVGEDGRARAVRLISISERSAER
jgi:hypothetical protein